jgi:hypothetical protein
MAFMVPGSLQVEAAPERSRDKAQASVHGAMEGTPLNVAAGMVVCGHETAELYHFFKQACQKEAVVSSDVSQVARCALAAIAIS